MSDQLNDLIDKRRKSILNFVYQSCQGKVQYGPFTGMKIIPKFCWGDGDLGGKLLGLYENELFEIIENVIEDNPDLIINYGCAEGFYGIGLALRLPNTKVISLDIEPKALDIAKENAEENNVKNIEFSRECNHEYLENILSQYQKPFIIMDCEGAEDVILDPYKIPSLEKTNILVETHDCLYPGITSRLIDKFEATHDLGEIMQGPKNLHIEPIKILSDLDKLILCNENRPCTMSWILMTPKE